MDKIRVMIVEDDPAWIKAISSYLIQQDDIIIIGTACTKEEAVKMASIVEIDVILMDINLTENQRDGIVAALEILRFSNARIIMLTALNDKDVIKDSFTVGAVDFISKEDYLDITKAIRKSYNNSSPIQVILEDYGRLKKEEQLKELTRAEKEIFQLMEQGYSQSQIRERLFKTDNTLRTQIKKILKKLGVCSSKDAIKKVQTKGILEKDEYKN